MRSVKYIQLARRITGVAGAGHRDQFTSGNGGYTMEQTPTGVTIYKLGEELVTVPPSNIVAIVYHPDADPAPVPNPEPAGDSKAEPANSAPAKEKADEQPKDEFESMNVAELRKAAAKRGINSSGLRKDGLLAALREAPAD